MAFPLYPTYPQYYPQPMPDYRMMAQAQPQPQPMQNQQMAQPQQQMAQPTQMQQNVPMQSMTQGISVASRPVGNREEALGVPADFSGAPMVFPDAAHDTVYIKRWDMNKGTAEFAEYARVTSDSPSAATTQEQPQAQPTPAFASVDALAALEQRIVALENRKKPAVTEKSVERHTERPAERDKSGRYVSKKKEVAHYEPDDEYDAE